MRSLRCLTILATLAVGLFVTPAATADLIDFEDLFLKPESFYNGDDGAGGFLSRGAFFNNDYHPQFRSWKGWSYSNRTDIETPGFDNQYSAWALPGGGGDKSANYAVAFNFDVGDAFILLPEDTRPESVRITNTTYTGLTMLYGDPFSKRFGGKDGTDPDWFLLEIYGFDEDFNYTGTVEFYLADYRYDESELDYIVAEWTTVDLKPLGNARYLFFGLSSSDNGAFGMNTPAYFALDSLRVGPRR